MDLENIAKDLKTVKAVAETGAAAGAAVSAAFEVEFSDRNGRTYESLGLRPEQIMVLHFEPASPDSVPEMVTV